MTKETTALRVTTDETICRVVFGNARHDVRYVTAQLRQIKGFLASVEKACKIDLVLSCDDSALESQCREDGIYPLQPDWDAIIPVLQRYDSALSRVAMTDDVDDDDDDGYDD